MAQDLQLGYEIRDRITGITGIMVAHTNWLYGCERVTLQPPVPKDGSSEPGKNLHTIDMAQAELVKTDTGLTPGPKALADPIVLLGMRVKDRISKVGGIAIARTIWLYGSTSIVIQPEAAKDGKPAEDFSVNEDQVEIVKAETEFRKENKTIVEQPKEKRRAGNPGNPSRGYAG